MADNRDAIRHFGDLLSGMGPCLGELVPGLFRTLCVEGGQIPERFELRDDWNSAHVGIEGLVGGGVY